MTDLSRRAVPTSALASGAAASLPRGASADLRLVMNDASRLNPTPVVREPEPREHLIAAIRAELKDAAAGGRPHRENRQISLSHHLPPSHSQER